MPPAKRDAAAIGNTAASGGRHGQALRIPLSILAELTAVKNGVTVRADVPGARSRSVATP